MEETGSHSWWKIIIVVVHVLLFAGSIVVSRLANGTPSFVTNRNRTVLDANSSALNTSGRGVFLFDDIRTKGNRYERAPISPAPWAFGIWYLIYTWQFLHMVYSLSLLVRKNSAGEYLYNARKPHIPFTFYLVFMLSTCALISWNFVYDRGILEASFALLLLAAVSIFASGAIVAYNLNKAASVLEKSKLSYDIWLTRILTLNGVAFYGTWCTIAMLLSLNTLLIQVAKVKIITSVWIFLGLLTAKIITWFVMETFVFDHYLRYLFSPYVVLLVAAIAILDLNLVAPVPDYMYYAIVLLSLIGVFALIKVPVMFTRGRKQPVKYTEENLKSENDNEMKPV